jgi:hypothetical protein
MARTAKSVGGRRAAGEGAAKRGAGRRPAARSRATERGAAKRGAASARKSGAQAALKMRGWTIHFVSGDSLELEADSVSVDSSGTVTFSLGGNEVLYVSPANYSFVMEASEPLKGSE